MTRKRRITKPAPVATSAAAVYSPARTTRSSSGAATASLLTPPTRAKSASASAAALGAQLASDPPILSPPLKKRVHTRSDARAAKVPSLEAALDDQDDFDDEQRGYDGGSSTRHNIKPDPHLPDPYKRDATVLHYKGSVYDAMLTRVRLYIRLGGDPVFSKYTHT